MRPLGYTGIWIGGSPGGDLSSASRLLKATDRVSVATGIVNIWKGADPIPGYRAIAERVL